jgi:hypothetical protein
VVPKGNWLHIADLLQPSQGNRAKWGQQVKKKRDLVEVLVAARQRFRQVKGRELTAEELGKLVGAVKTCRFVLGNRVVPGLGMKTLSFGDSLADAKQ